MIVAWAARPGGRGAANTQTPSTSPPSTRTRATGFTQPAAVEAVQTRRPQKITPNAPSDQPTLALVSLGEDSESASAPGLKLTAGSVGNVSDERPGAGCPARVDHGACVRVTVLPRRDDQELGEMTGGDDDVPGSDARRVANKPAAHRIPGHHLSPPRESLAGESDRD